MITTQTYKIGDCLELLPEIPDKSIDMILTDLPYVTTQCKWDTPIDLKKLWQEYKRIIKDNGAIVLTASQPFTSILITSNLKMYRYNFVWNKIRKTGFLNAKKRPLKRHEDICVFSKTVPKYNPQMVVGKPHIRGGWAKTKKSDVYNSYKIREPYESNEYYPDSILSFMGVLKAIHPTEKPLSLWEYLIKTYTYEGDTVHDSCLGSGTTLEACHKLNRNCIGFEISHDWEGYYSKRIKADVRTLDAYASTVRQ